MSRALLIVDFQNDFTSGGALEVPEGDEVAEPIKRLAPHFDHVFGAALPLPQCRAAVKYQARGEHRRQNQEDADEQQAYGRAQAMGAPAERHQRCFIANCHMVSAMHALRECKASYNLAGWHRIGIGPPGISGRLLMSCLDVRLWPRPAHAPSRPATI